MISKVLSVTFGFFSFIYTCYILYSLTYFLSNHNGKDKNRRIVSDDNIIQSTLSSLLMNMLLLSAFIYQHSVMANEVVKYAFCRLHIEYLNRSIYNACAAAVIHILMNQWQYTSISIWNIDTSSNAIWLFFTGLHVFAWSMIYSGCIMMDISELCGLKQVWYKVSGRNSPIDRKSRELKRYMMHMRHPSFTGFFIILWMYPCMSLDRLLLASILTIYMMLMWTIDSEDYNYHIRYFKRKQIELS